jgi:hypothetical protein
MRNTPSTSNIPANEVEKCRARRPLKLAAAIMAHPSYRAALVVKTREERPC